MRRPLPYQRFLTGTLFLSATALALAATSPLQERADRFLALANAGYKGLYKVSAEAQWAAVTDVKPEHDAAAATAGKAAAAFNGNPSLINEAKELLSRRSELNGITVRQLDKLLRNAAEGPMTNPELVAARVEAETRQASTLNGFEFKLDGQAISVNEIDNKLDTSTDLEERRRVWEASKESGVALKEGLVKLRELRNRAAKELGHKDYFALQVAGYGMTTDEMVKLHDGFLKELRPLYLQLHTWTKHKLAEKFKQPIPKRIPAHWINNRWSQEWTGLVEAANIDDRFKDRPPEWTTKTAEQFYTGLGFKPLPASFWTKSDLYPVKQGETRKKNTHASCWHIDLEEDIRSLMSIESNSRWFYTAHHELGHGRSCGPARIQASTKAWAS